MSIRWTTRLCLSLLLPPPVLPRRAQPPNPAPRRAQAPPAPPDPLPVAGPWAGVHNNALIVAGGANFPKPVWDNDKAWHRTIHVLVKEGRQYIWKPGGKLARSLAYGAAVSTSEGVVCIGGNDAVNTFGDVFLLSWDANREEVSSRTYPSLPQPCAFGAATLVDNVIYLAGGQSGQTLDTAMTNFWSLDLSQRHNPDKFAWQQRKAWPGPSRALNITAHQDDGNHECVYVISGRRQEGEEVQFLTDNWKYTPATDSWSRCRDIPQSVMAGPGIGYRKNQLLVLGGTDGSMYFRMDELRDMHPGFPKQAWSYQTRTDRWSHAGSTPANQVTTIAVEWNGSIIMPSGEVRPRVRSAAVWRIR